MKQFIYLDIDNINSLVAQIDNGIEESYQQTHEKGNNSAEENSIGIEGNITGVFKIPAILKLGSTIAGEGKEIEKYAENEVFKEIHNKRLHDAVFNQLLDYLNNQNKINPLDLKSGSFIKGEGILEIIDFEYLDGLFQENAFMSYLKDTQANDIRKKIDGEQEILSNREKRRAHDSEIKKQVAQLISENNKQYEDIEKIIKAIKYIMPYKRMALSNKGFLLPLNSKYFRDAPDLLSFKYGGNITFMGYVTNVLRRDILSKDNISVFANLQAIINQTLFAVLPSTSDHLKVLHPLALYYEC